MGKLRTSEVGHTPIPASERDVFRLKRNSEMLLQQAGELIVILDTELSFLFDGGGSRVRTHLTFETIKDLPPTILQAQAKLKSPRHTKPPCPFDV